MNLKEGISYHQNRYRFAVTKIVPFKPEGDEVDVHESGHAYIARKKGISVPMMTSIPDGDSLGVTHVGRFDAAVAAGPHAMGCKGTGSDMFKVYMLAKNPGAAIKEAGSILSQGKNEVRYLARSLKQRRKMNEQEIDDAIKGKHEIFNARIVCEDTYTGQSYTEEQKTSEAEGIIFDTSKIPSATRRSYNQLPLAA